ncbi:MAG: LysM peptidoglycan-binding domain-containing protein, partial [Bacteroidota bacterium]
KTEETVESTTGTANISIPTPEIETPELQTEVLQEEEEDFMDEEDVVYLDELEDPFEGEAIEEAIVVRTHESETLLDTGFGEEEELVIPETPQIEETIIETPQAEPAMASGETYYTVKPKDTLYSIARSHGATVNQIMSWNNLSDNTIHPNQQLRVK